MVKIKGVVGACRVGSVDICGVIGGGGGKFGGSFSTGCGVKGNILYTKIMDVDNNNRLCE